MYEDDNNMNSPGGYLFPDLFEKRATEDFEVDVDPTSARREKKERKKSEFMDKLKEMGVDVGEDALIGTLLADKYRVESFLGRGGMSVVYKVINEQTGAPAALKILHEHLWQDDSAVKRFKMEAQALSRMRHPNLLGLNDFGITRDGQPFLVVDYLEGRTLTEAIKSNNGLPLPIAVEVIGQLADGLAAAHRVGVLHRDVKPDNIMFVSEGNDYRLKLVDFGVAKIIAEDMQQTSQLTRTGEVFGSPLYMSPEQCLGKKLSERTDIYLLGGVAFATITARPPLYGTNTLETMNKQITEVPPPFSRVRPDVLDPERSGGINVEDLEFVISKCMEKEPLDRYQSMEELSSHVKSIKIGEPIDRNQMRGLVPSPGIGTQGKERESAPNAVSYHPEMVPQQQVLTRDDMQLSRGQAEGGGINMKLIAIIVAVAIALLAAMFFIGK